MKRCMLAQSLTLTICALPFAAAADNTTLHIKEIDKVSPYALVVLDKQCPQLVQPYKLTDNVASLAKFNLMQHVEKATGLLAGRVTGFLTGAKTPESLPPKPNDQSIPDATRLAAKQLDWLPMEAELYFGERQNALETNDLKRDSRKGKQLYPVADQLLEEITSKIEEPHDYQFKLVILKNSGRNAMARPGGYLYVDQGLIEDSAKLDKAHFALAHEIAHVLQRHETKELQGMVVDSFKTQDELKHAIKNAKKEPAALFEHIQIAKNNYTQHHIDQELQADSCAARVLGRVYPERQQFAHSLQAFLQELPPAQNLPAQAAPSTETEKLAASMHAIVSLPADRHPNTQERAQNLNEMYQVVIKDADA